MSTAILAEPSAQPSIISPHGPMETDDALYEFVHGQRVEMPPMSVRAAMIASRIGSAINAFAKPKRIGEAFTELLIRLPVVEDESRERRPDVSFFCHPRLPVNSPQDPDARASDVVPDLAVEVTSPSDRTEAQREKVLEYFRSGVRSVWVVYPKLRLVDVYETSTTLRVFGPDDTLAGEAVLPGFELSVADLFLEIAAASR